MPHRQRDRQQHGEAEEHPAHPLVAPAAAVGVGRVAAMFAVDAHRHARQSSGYLAFECGQVARVHDRRAPFAEQFQQARVELDAVARGLVKGKALDVAALNAAAEGRRHVRQRDDRVPIGRRREMVDQVDDTVLETTGVEAVDDVNYQGRATTARRLRPLRRLTSSIDHRATDRDGPSNRHPNIAMLLPQNGFKPARQTLASHRAD